jgi:hypothetical protein
MLDRVVLGRESAEEEKVVTNRDESAKSECTEAGHDAQHDGEQREREWTESGVTDEEPLRHIL